MTKSNAPDAVVDVLVVGVALPDVAGQAMHRQVHLAEADGLGGLLLPVDRDLGVGVSLVLSTNSALCTNMPPEPQAGSKMRPWYGSMISTISLTRDVGVKNSPPLCPSAIANLPRKYS